MRTTLLSILLLAVGFLAGRATVAQAPPAGEPGASMRPGTARVEGPHLRGETPPTNPAPSETTPADEPGADRDDAPGAPLPFTRPDVELVREAVEGTRLRELQAYARWIIRRHIVEAEDSLRSVRASPLNVNPDYVHAATTEYEQQILDFKRWRDRLDHAATIERFLEEAGEEPETCSIELIEALYGGK